MDDWLILARLTRARGIRGEIAARPFAAPARFPDLREVFLKPASGNARRAGIERVWTHKTAVIFKFAGIDDRNGAEELEGCDVAIPAAERPEPAPGEFYHSDLAGCRVQDASGREIGVVRGVAPTGGVDLLELDTGVLIPFTSAICTRIDPENRLIVAQLPEGLEDLNPR